MAKEMWNTKPKQNQRIAFPSITPVVVVTVDISNKVGGNSNNLPISKVWWLSLGPTPNELDTFYFTIIARVITRCWGERKSFFSMGVSQRKHTETIM